MCFCGKYGIFLDIAPLWKIRNMAAKIFAQKYITLHIYRLLGQKHMFLIGQNIDRRNIKRNFQDPRNNFVFFRTPGPASCLSSPDIKGAN